MVAEPAAGHVRHVRPTGRRRVLWGLFASGAGVALSPVLGAGVARREEPEEEWFDETYRGCRIAGVRYGNKLEGWGPGRGAASWRNHNRVHRWVGGHMVGGASVNDPVFWLHHAFVDLLWSRWQQRHKGTRYLPAKPPAPGDAQHGRIVARHERLPPWDVTPDELEDHSRIYRYA